MLFFSRSLRPTSSLYLIKMVHKAYTYRYEGEISQLVSRYLSVNPPGVMFPSRLPVRSRVVSDRLTGPRCGADGGH